MIIVVGKQTQELDADEFEELAAGYRELLIDLGTGDGRFALELARRRPDALVVGIDPVAEAMAELAGRARRKRGQQPNLLYVVGSAELPPLELTGRADELHIILPWGSLMRGLILGESGVLTGIATFCRPGASITALLNTRIYAEPVPLEARDLPELTPKYVRRDLEPHLAAAGLELSHAGQLPPERLLELPSTWAKRLSHRNPPPTLELRLRRTGSPVSRPETEA